MCCASTVERSPTIAKLKIEDLDRIAQEVKQVIHLRDGRARARVVVHMGTCGIAAGAQAVLTALKDAVNDRQLTEVLVTTSSCAGLCSREPMITVQLPDRPAVKYADMTAEKAARVLEEHVIGGKIVQEYVLAVGSERVM